MTDTNQTPAVTNESTVEKLVPIFEEIATLSEDAKAIVKDAKDAGLDGAALQKIAKAKANLKLGDLIDSTKDLLDLAESLN